MIVKKRTYNPILLGLSSIVVAGASYALIAPGDTNTIEEPTSVLVESSIAIPEISQPVINQQAPVQVLAETEKETTNLLKPQIHKIKPGESISSIFSKLNLSKRTLHQIIHTNEYGKQFADIIPGKSLEIVTNVNGELESLVYKKNAIETLSASRDNDGFNVKLTSKEVKTKIASATATIHSSLFLDGKKAGLSDKLIMQLANIFAWDIDFALNLRENDQFTLTYEQQYVDGKKYDTGNILAAEFTNQGHSYTAVRYEDSTGKVSFYTPDGKNMRKTFLRTPVDFARISSRFNLKRKHPVLNRIRAHKGVDYAAATGTPIKSTGDGRIAYRGRKGGYGRVVIVKHGQGYSTLYAHMSAYKNGQKTGQHIKQGQVIGYVGKSGLATGPHLHYEFRINGVHRNPLTVKFPHAKSIKPTLMAEFKSQTEPLLSQLNMAKLSGTTVLAQNQQ